MGRALFKLRLLKESLSEPLTLNIAGLHALLQISATRKSPSRWLQTLYKTFKFETGMNLNAYKTVNTSSNTPQMQRDAYEAAEMCVENDSKVFDAVSCSNAVKKLLKFRCFQKVSQTHR